VELLERLLELLELLDGGGAGVEDELRLEELLDWLDDDVELHDDELWQELLERLEEEELLGGV
jgi:hypothetical protein